MHARPRLFLIDGSSQMYRAYHAIRGLSGPDGRSTNAVYGFVTMLRKLIADHTPEYIAASFDLAGPTFRDALVTDYKANRAPMPDDLAEQIPWVHEACEALGVPVLTSRGFEADDVIGTLARRAVDAGFDVVIVTGDKDFFQLVNGGIRVFNPRDEGTWFDRDAVHAKFGVWPEQVVDVLALMGDTIDNIKGVPGIGEKGARELIATYGSLDALLERAAEVPQKRYREGLLAHADDARQSRELARIHTDVPVTVDFETLKYRGSDRARCYELFGRLGFRSLLMEYAPTAETVEKSYTLVTDSAALSEVVAAAAAAERIGIHVIADGERPMEASLVGIAIADAPRRAWYVPVGRSNGSLLDAGGGLPLETILDALRGVLEAASPRKTGHDLKSAAVLLAQHGVTLGGLDFDTMIGSYLLDPTRSAHGIEDTALEHLGYKAVAAGSLTGKGARAIPIAELPPAALCDYAAERADLPLQLAPNLEARLEAEGLTRVWRELEEPLIPVLAAIEQAGVRIDTEVLRRQSANVERELDALAARIYALAGVEFNINSPRQLGEVLFEKMQLPTARRTGRTKAMSTAFEVLEELAQVHEMPRLVLDWRALQKLKGTYLGALPQLVNPRTGRVHTSFNQAVAATGRLSSSDPNLQNIPIRTELGREIRRAFIAAPGHVLISADYSQIELRVLAHLSGDETLIAAFQRGEDIHDRTALKVFGTDSGLSPHELRRRAKIINYALLYGKTAFTLAKDIGVTQQAAQEFIDAYFAGFPRVRAFIDRTLEETRATGVVRTMFGRRRLVPEITSRNGAVRAAAERMTVNMPIQGTAADILKLAMIALHRDLTSRNGDGTPAARMILTVHDELVFEVRREAADEYAALIRDRMQNATRLAVPLDVDVGIGENWKDAKS
ncbi:MAG TPA: DNA polymerase I [Vicinamibacterales bacterium]